MTLRYGGRVDITSILRIPAPLVHDGFDVIEVHVLAIDVRAILHCITGYGASIASIHHMDSIHVSYLRIPAMSSMRPRVARPVP